MNGDVPMAMGLLSRLSFELPCRKSLTNLAVVTATSAPEYFESIKLLCFGRSGFPGFRVLRTKCYITGQMLRSSSNIQLKFQYPISRSMFSYTSNPRSMFP